MPIPPPEPPPELAAAPPPCPPLSIGEPPVLLQAASPRAKLISPASFSIFIAVSVLPPFGIAQDRQRQGVARELSPIFRGRDVSSGELARRGFVPALGNRSVVTRRWTCSRSRCRWIPSLSRGRRRPRGTARCTLDCWDRRSAKPSFPGNPRHF